MVVSCSANNCVERFKKGGNITFHLFPTNEERRKKWLINMQREDFTPTKNSRICSKHFTEESFDREKFGGHWLKATAVPTIFDYSSRRASKSSLRKSRLKQKLSRDTLTSDLAGVKVEPPEETLIIDFTGSGTLREPPTTTDPPSTERPHKNHWNINPTCKKVERYIVEFSEPPTKACQVLQTVKSQDANENKTVEELLDENRQLKEKIASLHKVIKKDKLVRKLLRENKQLKEKMTSLQDVIKDLKQNSFISEIAGDILEGVL